MVVGLVLELFSVGRIEFLETHLPPKVLDDKRKAWGNLLCAALILVGVGIENLASGWIDEKTDEIRISQLRRIASAETELAKAENLISGNFEIVDTERLKKLSEFAGTPFLIQTTDTVAAAQSLGQSLMALETVAHWKQISEKTLELPKPQAGVILKTWPVQRANAAAQALRCFILFEFDLWPTVDQLKMPEDAAVPRDGVCIQIGRLDSREELSATRRKEALERRFPDCTQESETP